MTDRTARLCRENDVRPQKITRARFLELLGGLGGLVVAQSLPLGTLPPRQSTPSSMERRDQAVRLYAAMCRAFAGPRLFYDVYPRSSAPQPVLRYTAVWSHAIITSATLDMFGLPDSGPRYAGDVENRLAALRLYTHEQGPIVRDGYDPVSVFDVCDPVEKYNDDNAWVGLNLTRAARSLPKTDPGRSALIEQAEAVLDFILQSQTPAEGDRPRGIYWKKQYPHEQFQDVNTVSAAPTGQLAVELYQETGRKRYLEQALELHAWLNAYMRDADSLYWDHLKANGQVDKTKYSYNQGSVLGLNVLLYTATGNDDYLTEAETIARAAIDSFLNGAFHPKLLEFRYILFKNLLYLSAHSRNSELKKAIAGTHQDYLNQLLGNVSVHDNANLFHFGEVSVLAIRQAAAVGVLALGAWSPDTYASLF